MRLVIADTSPVNYLILIGCVDILPRLFEWVAIHRAVEHELLAVSASSPVHGWISAAIALAGSLGAELLLIDERAGFRIAKDRGLRVTGTLGLLDLAAERGLIDFAAAMRQLERTSFRRPEQVMQALMAKHSSPRRTADG